MTVAVSTQARKTQEQIALTQSHRLLLNGQAVLREHTSFWAWPNVTNYYKASGFTGLFNTKYHGAITLVI